jgi:hypothetical protein
MSIEPLRQFIKEHSSQIIVVLFALLLLLFAALMTTASIAYLLASLMVADVLGIVIITSISK